MRKCKSCIYREDCSFIKDSSDYNCSDYIKGDPEDLAEHETDISEFTGEESYEDFMEHEDFE